MLHADSRLHGPSDGALPPSAEAVPPVVPGYRVERELGRGGRHASGWSTRRTAGRRGP